MNASETVSSARFRKQWLDRPLCSVDTIGRVYANFSCDGLRTGIHRLRERLKRNKALPLNLGRDVAVLDGHESHASYRRHCTGSWGRWWDFADLLSWPQGKTRLRDFTWEPYVARVPPRPAETAIPKPPRVEKREARRQQTLAARKAKRAAETCARPVAVAADSPQTLLGMGRGLLSWTQCPAPLTAVVNREPDEHGQVRDWVLVSTSARRTCSGVRS